MEFFEMLFPTHISFGAKAMNPQFNTSVTWYPSKAVISNINWTESYGKWQIDTGLQNASDIALFKNFVACTKGRAFGFRYFAWDDYEITTQINFGRGDGSETEFQLRNLVSTSVITGSTDITFINTGSRITSSAADKFKYLLQDTYILISTVSNKGNGGLFYISNKISNVDLVLYETAGGDLATLTDESNSSAVMNWPVTIKTIKKPIAGDFTPQSNPVIIYEDDVEKTLTTHYTIDETTGIITFGSAPGVGDVLTWTGEFHLPCVFGVDALQQEIANPTSDRITNITIEEYNIG